MSSNNLNNSTLVPVDFSNASFNALEHASAISKIIEDDNQEITLIHVIEDRKLPVISPDDDLSEFDNRSALMIEGTKTRLEKVVDQFRKKIKTPIKYLVSGGRPYSKIAKVAEEINADSIVMGTQGASGWEAFIGSNAAKVIQISPCPVVVVNEEHKGFGKGYKHIVLPLDLTKETKQKVAMATKVAHFFNSTIHIVSVAEEDTFLERRLKGNMKQVESYFSDHGVNYTSEILTDSSGNFADTTLDYARQVEADLVIIMTQQEKTFKELIIGSYAQQIVNKSNVPVMCVNPRQDLVGVFERLSPGV